MCATNCEKATTSAKILPSLHRHTFTAFSFFMRCNYFEDTINPCICSRQIAATFSCSKCNFTQDGVNLSRRRVRKMVAG